MSRMKHLAQISMVGAVLLLRPLSLPGQDKTAAEAYTDYVTDFIPLSFDLARQNAGIKESAVFIQLESEAQSHLVQATDDAAAFGFFAPQITGNVCSLKADGSVDLETNYRQYVMAGQLLAASKAIQQHRVAYQQIRTGLASACNKSFDDYRIENVDMDFIQPDIELADGVYVESDGVAFFVTLAKSLWQIVTNYDEQQDIDDQVARLKRDRAKTDDYRRFASEACRESQVISEKMFTEYDQMIPTLDDFVHSVPETQLSQRRADLQTCISHISDTERSAMEESARAAVRGQLLGQNEREAQLKTFILAEQRIRRIVAELPNVPCGSDAPLILSLRAEAALGRSLGLASDLDLSKSVDLAINARADQCNKPSRLFSFLGVDRKRRLSERFSALMTLRPFATSSFEGAQNGDTCLTVDGYSFGPLCGYLANNGPTTPDGDSGAYTGSGGSFCTYSERAQIGSYADCGGSAFGQPTVSSDPYGAQRAIIAGTTGLPGQYNLDRGRLIGTKLEQQIQSIRENVQQLSTIRKDILDSQTQYSQQVFKPAAEYAVHEITSIQDAASKQLKSALEESQPLPAPPGPDFGDSGFSLSATPINALRRRLEDNSNTGRLRDDLETLWLVTQYKSGTLASPDQAELRTLYQEYFDSNGMLNAKALGPELGGISEQVSRALPVSGITPQITAVRYELDRALFGIASSNDPGRTDYGYGSLGFGIAADIAYSENDFGSGDQLLSIATKAADIALGLLPVAGGVNDAAQIIFGAATGHDYTGREMRAGDYALRGLGVAVSLLPGAEPVIRLGSATISNFFLKGATLLKRLGLQDAFFEGIKRVPSLVADFTSLIGEYFSSVPMTEDALLQIAPRAEELVSAETRLLTGTDEDLASGIWESARQSGSAVDDGSTLLLKKSPEVIGDAPADGLFARIVRKDADIAKTDTGALNPSDKHAFITAASDIEGLETSNQIAERLSLFVKDSTTEYRNLSDDVVVVFKFKNGFGPPAIPWDFAQTGGYSAGWIPGGFTVGGAREWIVDTDLSEKGFIEVISRTPIKPSGGS
jgi:hypothetical protein